MRIARKTVAIGAFAILLAGAGWQSLPNSGMAPAQENRSDLVPPNPAVLPQRDLDLSGNAITARLGDTSSNSLTQAYEEARHQIIELTDDHKQHPQNLDYRYFASNPSQNLIARFSETSLQIISGFEGREWEASFGIVVSGGELSAEGGRVTYNKNGNTEWFENRPGGIEHGFTLDRDRRTERRDGEALVLDVALSGVAAEPDPESPDDLVLRANGEPVLGYRDLKVWDATGATLLASMSPSPSGIQLTVQDQQATYPLTIDPLIYSLEQRLGPPTTGVGSGSADFGVAMAISADESQVLIGSPQHIGSAADDFDPAIRNGQAYLFSLTRSGAWQLIQVIRNPNPGDSQYFGTSVAMNSDTLFVGARQNINDTGVVYAFGSGADGRLQQTIRPADGEPGDYFGTAISLTDTHLFIGSPDRDTGIGGNRRSGVVYAYKKFLDTWKLSRTIDPPNPQEDDDFGEVLDSDGTTLVVGLPNNSAAGTAWVFVASGDDWNVQAEIQAADGSVSDQFGTSVAISGNSIIIGASRVDGALITAAGAAYVFTRIGSSWTEEQKLTSSSEAVGIGFGGSVAISGDRALVAANLGSSGRRHKAFLFERVGTTWTEEFLFSEPVENESNQYAEAVIVTANLAIISAPQQDYVGSVFSYRAAESWAVARSGGPGASYTDAHFGSPVAISGDIAVVGARDAHSATERSPGAIFILERNAGTWSHAQSFFGATASSSFGGMLDLAGDSLIVVDTSSKDVFVYQRTAGVWAEEDQIEDNAPDFITSAAIDGNYAALGFSGMEEDGRVRIYVRSGGEWQLDDELSPRPATPENPEIDRFGRSIDLDGNYLAVAAEQTASFAPGRVIIYRRGLSWDLSREIDPGLEDPGYGRFSLRLALDDSTLILGDHDRDCLVYTRQGSSNWSFQDALESPLPTEFGSSFALDGDLAVIGAPRSDELVYGTGLSDSVWSGAAHIFQRSGDEWSHQITLRPDDLSDDASFGIAVDIDGDSVIVGASEQNGDLFTTDQGAAYVFRLDVSDHLDYDDWTNNAGLHGDDAQPGASPACDGISNALKYAFNLSGVRPDYQVTIPSTGTSGLPSITTSASGGDLALTIEYLRRKGGDAIYLPLTSTDLVVWKPFPAAESVEDIDTEWERVTVSRTFDPSLTQRVFGTVRVTVPAP